MKGVVRSQNKQMLFHNNIGLFILKCKTLKLRDNVDNVLEAESIVLKLLV